MEKSKNMKVGFGEMDKQGRTLIVQKSNSGSRIDEESNARKVVADIDDEVIETAIAEALPSYKSLMQKVYSADNQEMLDYAIEKFSEIPQEPLARSAKLANCHMITMVEITTPSIVPVQKVEPTPMSAGSVVTGLSETGQES